MSELKLEHIGHPDAVSNALTFDSDGTLATGTGFSSGGLKVKSSGGGTFSINPPSSATNRTLTLPDEAGTVLTSASQTVLNIGYGAFRANASPTNQAISNSTNTKVTFNTESFDPDGVYDTSNSRYTPQVAGLYYIHAFAQISGFDSTAYYASLKIYKNGSRYADHITQMRTAEFPSIHVTASVYLNGTTDYIEIYAFQNSGGNKTVYTGDWGEFTGYLVRAS